MKVESVAQKKGSHTRKGRGFSRGELMEAGVDSRRALRLGIPIDPRRKTKHQENVKRLKQHLQSSP